MNGMYILDENNEHVPCDDTLEWARWFEVNSDRRVVSQTIVLHPELGDLRVSTVFLGLDHSWGLGGAPLLYETMVFPAVRGRAAIDYQTRCATRAEAIAMHTRAIDHVLAGGGDL